MLERTTNPSQIAWSDEVGVVGTGFTQSVCACLAGNCPSPICNPDRTSVRTAARSLPASPESHRICAARPCWVCLKPLPAEAGDGHWPGRPLFSRQAASEKVFPGKPATRLHIGAKWWDLSDPRSRKVSPHCLSSLAGFRNRTVRISPDTHPGQAPKSINPTSFIPDSSLSGGSEHPVIIWQLRTNQQCRRATRTTGLCHELQRIGTPVKLPQGDIGPDAAQRPLPALVNDGETLGILGDPELRILALPEWIFTAYLIRTHFTLPP